MTSSKKFIIISGPPGVGKTTIIKRLCEKLQRDKVDVQGFYTEEVRSGRERIGFDVVSIGGVKSNLARINSDVKGPSVGKYIVDVPSFEKLAIPLISPVQPSILVIDEIGKMELISNIFKKRVSDLLEENGRILLATIPVEKGAPIPILTSIRSHPSTQLYIISRSNRDSIIVVIYKFLSNQLGSKEIEKMKS